MADAGCRRGSERNGTKPATTRADVKRQVGGGVHTACQMGGRVTGGQPGGDSTSTRASKGHIAAGKNVGGRDEERGVGSAKGQRPEERRAHGSRRETPRRRS